MPFFLNFQVWNEVIAGADSGATNFLTGSGGFLQSIYNGYAGIKIYINRLEIANPRMPTTTTGLTISGSKTACTFCVY